MVSQLSHGGGRSATMVARRPHFGLLPPDRLNCRPQRIERKLRFPALAAHQCPSSLQTSKIARPLFGIDEALGAQYRTGLAINEEHSVALATFALKERFRGGKMFAAYRP